MTFPRDDFVSSAHEGRARSGHSETLKETLAKSTANDIEEINGLPRGELLLPGHKRPADFGAASGSETLGTETLIRRRNKQHRAFPWSTIRARRPPGCAETRQRG
jgi:hypothetical protein